jgi:Flp pilus assembly protein TadG
MFAFLPLIGFATLAVDVNNMLLASAELQNAADAGALAGAAKLSVSSTAAATAAGNAARANNSQDAVVEMVTGTITTTGKGTGDVDVGCWTFTSTGGTFAVSGTDCGTAGSLNAVRVVTHRTTTPIRAFFGNTIGFPGYSGKTTAIAYKPPSADLIDWVICPTSYYNNYSNGSTSYMDIVSSGNGNDTVSVRRLQNPIVVSVGTNVEIKTGNGNVPPVANLRVPLVDSCPKITGTTIVKVVKMLMIVDAKKTKPPCLLSGSPSPSCITLTDSSLTIARPVLVN